MLADSDGGDPELILIATGSEVALAVAAHEKLVADGVRSRVVSLPSCYLFDQQDQTYREPGAAARGHGAGSRSRRHRRWAGTATSAREGEMIGMHTFGSSAPLKDVLGKFGFTPEKVVETAHELLEKERR